MIENFKQELSKDGFNFTEVTDELLVIEDFLLKSELEEILGIINNTTDEDWQTVYKNSLKAFCMEKFGRDDVDNLVAEGKYEITQNWYDKNYDIVDLEVSRTVHGRLQQLITKSDNTLELSGFATLQRMQPGVELKSHTDQKTDPSIQYAAILYLNDDYVDGTLFFKNLDIDLRPKPGSLLIFPGNEKYEHGVRHVGEGPIRYVLVGFIKITGFYEKNKY